MDYRITLRMGWVLVLLMIMSCRAYIEETDMRGMSNDLYFSSIRRIVVCGGYHLCAISTYKDRNQFFLVDRRQFRLFSHPSEMRGLHVRIVFPTNIQQSYSLSLRRVLHRLEWDDFSFFFAHNHELTKLDNCAIWLTFGALCSLFIPKFVFLGVCFSWKLFWKRNYSSIEQPPWFVEWI